MPASAAAQPLPSCALLACRCLPPPLGSRCLPYAACMRDASLQHATRAPVCCWLHAAPLPTGCFAGTGARAPRGRLPEKKFCSTFRI